MAETAGEGDASQGPVEGRGRGTSKGRGDVRQKDSARVRRKGVVEEGKVGERLAGAVQARLRDGLHARAHTSRGGPVSRGPYPVDRDLRGDDVNQRQPISRAASNQGGVTVGTERKQPGIGEGSKARGAAGAGADGHAAMPGKEARPPGGHSSGGDVVQVDGDVPNPQGAADVTSKGRHDGQVLRGPLEGEGGIHGLLHAGREGQSLAAVDRGSHKTETNRLGDRHSRRKRGSVNHDRSSRGVVRWAPTRSPREGQRCER